MVISKSFNGLLFRDSFADLSGWTQSGGTGWSTATDPAVVVFDPSKIDALNPTVEFGDFGCVRQPEMYVEDGVWYLMYDSYDLVTGGRQYIAVSRDRGLTWRRTGPTSEKATKVAGGSWMGVASGWIEKRGATYYKHRVICAGTFGWPNVMLGGGPYYWDVWKADDILGEWEPVRQINPEAGSAFSAEELPGTVVFDGTKYHAFIQGNNGATSYKIGRTESTEPDGSFAIVGSTLMGSDKPGFFSRPPENPRVFYSSTLGRWAMMVNLIATDSTHTDANAVVISSSLTDWSASVAMITQRLTPIDNDNTHAIGVGCHWTGPDGALIEGIGGKVPFTFDNKPTRYFSYGSHQGRSASYAVMEPSPFCVKVNVVVDNTNRLSRAIEHSDFSAEYALKFGNGVGGTQVGFWFRQDGSGNGYRLTATNGGTLLLQKTVAGTTTTVATGSGSQVTGSYWIARIKVSAIGTNIRAWLDGELQINATDAAFSSGSYIQFSAKNAVADVRLFSMRSSDSVTISGMAPGSSAIVRGAGGIPFSSAVANDDGQATATLPHWPHDEIEINGVSYNGEIWGGDTFSVDNPNKFRGRVTL